MNSNDINWMDKNTNTALKSAPRTVARVHVSFPAPPDALPGGRSRPAQLSAFVHGALAARFGDRVVFTPWDRTPPLRGDDALVTAPAHPALAWWKRSVVVGTDDFAADRRRRAAPERPWLEGQFGLVILSDDAAMGRVMAADPSVMACFNRLRSAVTRFVAYPHPIDKPFFHHHRGAGHPTPDRVRMLVLHDGRRRNSARLIALSLGMGFVADRDFAVIDPADEVYADPSSLSLRRFPIVADVSLAEAAPIDMTERLAAGHIVLGNGEWWEGGGDPRLVWSDDPARMGENAAHLDRLLRGMSVDRLVAERDRLWEWLMEREDNDWSVVADAVGDQVDELLADRHPAMIHR